MASPSPRVVMSGICKSFPGVLALKDVDFAAYPGEVHALLGENGAGKSTLIKVLTGVYPLDSGTISLDGKTVTIGHPSQAEQLGISTVYQEVNLVPSLSVVKNLTLQRQPRKGGLISWRQAREQTQAALARLHLDIDVERPVGAYSVATQQLIAIARALHLRARVLVLDEATASLDAHEVELLFGIVRELRASGMTVVFITHFLDQVYQVCDRITVLRNGRLAGSALAADLPKLGLVSMMLGHEFSGLDASRPPDTVDPARTVLEAKGVGAKRYLDPFDLSVHAGEAVGLAGLLGSGRTEVAKLCFGAVHSDSGTIRFEGRDVALHSPRQAIRLGLGFCPEDRKREGLVLELSVRENIILAMQTKRGWLNRVSDAEQREVASAMIKALAIATPDAERPVGNLSGGNQQKVVLARWLAARPKLLILDEPTRGIDVGAHAEIVALVHRLCAEGMAVLVASSELDEVVAISHRVVVMRDHRKIAEISGTQISRDTIVKTIAGADEHATH